ncbi:MAG TPA: 2-amino-4-hydroxy-6-hydroxymethyldihydropteridine diphosphokinase [Chitinophagaceae bacterium]
MNLAYILTGGNLGDREENLRLARVAIEQNCGRITCTSALYETEAWGLKDQGPFLNQALELKTGQGAKDLLEILLSIELSLGRVRDVKYGPRIIDIDIIFFNHEVIELPGLVVPHPQMHLRRFALEALAEIAPGYRHPVFNKPVSQLLAECTDTLAVNKLG